MLSIVVLTKNGATDLQIRPSSLQLSIDSVLKCCTLQKAAGQEWYLDMVNPTSDGRFNPQDQITRNSDGSWKMRSDQVRMQVYTSNGYNSNQITSDSGQSKVATRGFMGSSEGLERRGNNRLRKT